LEWSAAPGHWSAHLRANGGTPRINQAAGTVNLYAERHGPGALDE
jgi:hypothetical protein